MHLVGWTLGAPWHCSTHGILQCMQSSGKPSINLQWQEIWMNRTNFQTFHSAVEKPSVLRPQGMETGQDALQDTHSTQELPWDCSSTASTPCSLWSLQENCSGPLQSHLFPNAWIPQVPLSILPGLAALHQLLIQTFKTKSQTQTAFFLLLRLHIEVFRVTECKEYFVLPILCDFQTDKWKRISEVQCCWPAPLRHLHHLQHLALWFTEFIFTIF